VLRGVVDDEATLEPAPLGFTVSVGEGLEAMGVEVVEDDVDPLRVGVRVADPFHRSGETTGLSIRRRVGEVPAGLGATMQKMLAVPRQTYS